MTPAGAITSCARGRDIPCPPSIVADNALADHLVPSMGKIDAGWQSGKFSVYSSRYGRGSVKQSSHVPAMAPVSRTGREAPMGADMIRCPPTGQPFRTGALDHPSCILAETMRSGLETGSPRLILSTFSIPSVTLPHTVY